MTSLLILLELGVQKLPPTPLPYPRIINGITSYPPMMVVPAKIYLDGTEVSSESASGAVASTTATLLLGASDMNDSAGTIAAARHSGIKLDEVRFYSSGLTSSQVSALYNFGKGDIGNIGEFANLPSKISGTKGTALSTTVAAAFPNAYYEAVNLTPGLSINASTGEISGTPTVGGVGSITVIARNATGKRAVINHSL